MEQMQPTDSHRDLEQVVGLLRTGSSYEEVQAKHPHLSIGEIKSYHEIGIRQLHVESVHKPVYCRLDFHKR